MFKIKYKKKGIKGEKNKTKALEVTRKKKAQETKKNKSDNLVNEENKRSFEIEKITYEECQINNT